MSVQKISVPRNYIRNKAIDFEGELFSVFKSPLVLGSLRLYSPPVGVFALLEMIDSEYYRNPCGCTALDYFRALWIASRQGLAVDSVRAHLAAKAEASDPAALTAWDREVLAWGATLGDAPFAMYDQVINWLLVLPFNGYEMIPRRPPAYSSRYLYGADLMASVIALAGPALQCGADELLWRVPLALVGHIAAAEALKNGVKGVARPKDPEDIQRQIDDAVKRELAGELHPWQYERPDIYAPSHSQLAARPEIAAEHKTLLEAMRNQAAKRKV